MMYVESHTSLLNDRRSLPGVDEHLVTARQEPSVGISLYYLTI